MIRGLIGMVHLGPLPGSPRHQPIEATIEAALADAAALEETGFDGLMIENFGDSPFFPDDVPSITIAAMTRVVAAIADATTLPFGVNVLRNDGLAAVAIAAATGAGFVRINILSGSMWTDQGPIVGRAAEVARLRESLGPEIAVLADVMVKHATPPPGLTIDSAAIDLWERAGADGIIVSGSGTGRPLDAADLAAVAAAVPDAPLYAGSGVTVGTVKSILDSCAGAIVGTALKVDGVTINRVDRVRARMLVDAAR